MTPPEIEQKAVLDFYRLNPCSFLCPLCIGTAVTLTDNTAGPAGINPKGLHGDIKYSSFSFVT